MDVSRSKRTTQVLDFLYKSLPVALTGSLGGAVLLVLMLYRSVEHRILYIWIGVLFFIVALRFGALFYYRYALAKNSIGSIHIILYFVGACLTGSAWGSSIYFLTITDAFSVNLMVMLMLVGVSAGAIGSNAASTLGYVLYIAPIMVPLFIFLFTHPMREMNIAAYTVILFVMMLLSISRNFRKQYFSMHSFADEKNELVERLSSSNKLLADEVDMRKRTEIDLREAKISAETASRAKSTFLSHMSHELRTPLNSIIGFSDLLVNDDNLQTPQRDYARQILGSGGHLLTLVDDILDLTRIESGTLVLDRRNIALQTAVATCASIIQPIADKRNITVKVEANNMTPVVRVKADEKRLKQIFINLLSNAVKYNRDGGTVTVSYQVTETHVEIIVADTGIGIESERINDLFQSFNRLGRENTGIDGTGIGLVITKQLVLMMDGDISVESQIGVGTRFSIRFPIVKNAEQIVILSSGSVGTNSSSIDSSKNVKCLRILVAEDNLSNQMIIRKQLQSLGHEVVMVDDGGKAIDAWRKGSYDMLLTDCHMPVLDGFRLAAAIRELEKNSSHRIPIIALTADAYADVAKRCIECGMDDAVTKPITMEQLKKVVSRWSDISTQSTPLSLFKTR